MSEVRLARAGEVIRQKEIWKLCFGDSKEFIEFYYASRYRPEDTVVLLCQEEIAAMLTMIPVQLNTSDHRSLDATMLYAVATHPQYQHQGFATQLMDFTHYYLEKNNKKLAILVPADQSLFDFYRKFGYQEGFYIREIRLTPEIIDNTPSQKSQEVIISALCPEDYNQRRNGQLKGRLSIEYAVKELAYQKQLAVKSGADLLGIDSDGVQGCAILERMDSDRVIIKELLIPDEFMLQAIKQMMRRCPAKEYILRLPASLGEQFGGSVRPFGMYRAFHEDLEIVPEDLGYLGIAFD